MKCTICNEWIHLRCSVLTSADLQSKEKIEAIKCNRCEARADEEDECDEAIILDATQASTSDNELLKQILAELKSVKKSLKVLVNENTELKISVEALTNANSRLAKQVESLSVQRAKIGGRTDRSQSRVRLAADINEKRGPQGREPRQRNKRVSSPRDNIMTRPNGSGSDTMKRKTLIKRIDRRVIPGVEATIPSAKPRLPSARTRIQTRKLHISNMSESVTAEAVYKHVVTHGNVHPIAVKKLRTRRAGCGSRFHVEVLDVDYDNVINDDLWEDGTEISFYRGPLHADLVIETFPNA